ncbi:hypothetical protein INR49_032538 [Caranx melampygus]|nr:hypothetical protein INR49_032538 [Caranx melampygus]
MNRSGTSTQKSNLPNHQGRSTGIPAGFDPHPSTKQGVSKCPEGKKSLCPVKLSEHLDNREAGRSVRLVQLFQR